MRKKIPTTVSIFFLVGCFSVVLGSWRTDEWAKYTNGNFADGEFYCKPGEGTLSGANAIPMRITKISIVQNYNNISATSNFTQYLISGTPASPATLYGTVYYLYNSKDVSESAAAKEFYAALLCAKLNNTPVMFIQHYGCSNYQVDGILLME